MRAGASVAWRAVTAVAFGATAALAVIVSRGAPISAALASDKAGAAHASASPRPSAAPARCAAAGLRISLSPGAQVATAVTRYRLDFTNVTAAPCTLTGYPAVAAYRGDGAQVGPAAARDRSAAARRVLLAPGQTAHAVLDAAAPVARCRPVRVSGLRVVTPGQAGTRYVRHSLTACAARPAPGRDYLVVRAITPGSGPGPTANAGGGDRRAAD